MRGQKLDFLFHRRLDFLFHRRFIYEWFYLLHYCKTSLFVKLKRYSSWISTNLKYLYQVSFYIHNRHGIYPTMYHISRLPIYCDIQKSPISASIQIMFIQTLNNWAFFSCDQAAIRTLQSVRPSLPVRPSVTPFSQCSCHRVITKFSGAITINKSDVHAKGQGQMSKVKVTEVKTRLSRFRTVTPVWNHRWFWNDAQSLM